MLLLPLKVNLLLEGVEADEATAVPLKSGKELLIASPIFVWAALGYDHGKHQLPTCSV